MERRTFVKTLGGSTVVVLLPAALQRCAKKPLEALRAWDGPGALAADADARLALVSYAILAPNAHNKQPWLVDLRGEGIDLYVDPTRLLPQTDPPARQIMISQGTFLETLVIAATHYGLAAEVVLFPNGIDALADLGKRPVAHVDLRKREGRAEDALFPFVLERHTNRRVYEGPPLSEAEAQALVAACASERCSLRLLSEPGAVAEVARMMTEAMRIETHTRAMHAETVDMLRFDDGEIERYRDGISFPNLGITGVRLMLVGWFAGRKTAFDEAFLTRTVESVSAAAFSARAVGVLSSAGDTRADEVEAGRRFARVFLTATRLGLSLQPMSQVLEIEAVRSEFVNVVGAHDAVPQMVFRVGRAAPTPHSPRRTAADLVRS